MRQKGVNMIISNKLKTMQVIAAGLTVFCAACLFAALGNKEREGKDNPGIPDAVSSMSDGETCRLTVVANSGTIGDEEKFARMVIEMCRENSFQSLRLSTDIGGWSEKLDIRVYLRKRDIGKREPAMHILYEPADDGENYDIRNDEGKYHMTVWS